METLCNKASGLQAPVQGRHAEEATAKTARMLAQGLRVLLFWLGWALSAAAAPTWQIEHCNNPGVKQLSEALICQWQAEAAPRKGWGEASRWMRVRIAAQSDSTPELLALQVQPHFLGRIDLHQEGPQGQWQQKSAGSQLPGSQAFAVLGGYEFPLPHHTQEQLLYLEVHSQNVHAIGLKVKTQWRADQAVPGLGRVDIGVQLGLLAMVALLAMIGFALHPQRVMGRFALSSVNMLLCMASGSGLLALTLLQDHPKLDEALFHTLVCLRVSLWIWVSQALIEAYKPPAWFAKACGALHAAVAVAVALNLLGFQAATYALMLPVLLTTPLVLTWGTWRTQGVPAPFKRILTGGPLLSGLLIVLVIALAMLPSWAFDGARYAAWLTDLANTLVLLSLVVLQQRSQLAQLQNVQDELMRARLQSDFERRLLTERQVLIDMLVHELKNPLASIRLALASLFAPSQAQDLVSARRLHNIQRSIQDMTSVLERCELMNSLEQEQAGSQRSQVDLVALLQDLVNSTAEPQRFRLNLTTTAIHSQPDFLRLVASNLLENALKYSPPESDIDVELREGNTMQLIVKNQVDHEMQPDPHQIFSRYYRHPLAQRVRGTGLGLFLVREICQRMGARIYFEAAPRQVQFTLELPR
jgi:signal transduction histidine kinase